MSKQSWPRTKSDLATRTAPASAGEQLCFTENSMFRPQVRTPLFEETMLVSQAGALPTSQTVSVNWCHSWLDHHSPKFNSVGRCNPSERVSGTRSNNMQRSEITIRTHSEMIPVLDLCRLFNEVLVMPIESHKKVSFSNRNERSPKNTGQHELLASRARSPRRLREGALQALNVITNSHIKISIGSVVIL